MVWHFKRTNRKRHNCKVRQQTALAHKARTPYRQHGLAYGILAINTFLPMPSIEPMCTPEMQKAAPKDGLSA
jgi:hypothetical protein